MFGLINHMVFIYSGIVVHSINLEVSWFLYLSFHGNYSLVNPLICNDWAWVRPSFVNVKSGHLYN